MSVPSVPSATRSRRRWAALGGALAVLIAAVVAVLLAIGGSADQSASVPVASSPAASPTVAAPTSTAPASASVAPAADTPEPTGPTEEADEPPPSLSPVALDQTAAVGNGIGAEVVSLEGIAGTAIGPGNVSGPALRVTVRLTNGTAEPVSLGGVAVELAWGPELVPASPLDDVSAAPFQGSVPAGGTAEGVYVFSIAEGDRAEVTLSVGYQAGAPFLVFTGDAS